MCSIWGKIRRKNGAGNNHSYKSIAMPAVIAPIEDQLNNRCLRAGSMYSFDIVEFTRKA
jgi:hypothetical protein